jgi:nicotinate-nucleotide pyrophosphorylase (carboxylating)
MKKTGNLNDDKIREFLREDIGYGDITSQSLIPVNQSAKAVLYFKEDGVASGLEEAGKVFEILGCKTVAHVIDGSKVKAREPLINIEGNARALLSGERVALNIVGRMAGIATATAKVIEITSRVNPLVRIAATRKTVPGIRFLDKKAILHGGGDTHRFGLDDCVLIKDNHLELVSSITEAVERVRKIVSFTKKIEVEVRTQDEAMEAALAGADIIMLDNMPPSDIRNCLKFIESKNLRKWHIFEASGGVTLNNVVDYASSGVDVISMGALTHSVRSLDVKLEIEMV